MLLKIVVIVLLKIVLTFSLILDCVFCKITSHTVCMWMYVDHYLKKTRYTPSNPTLQYYIILLMYSYSSPSCCVLIYWSTRMRYRRMSGVSCSLEALGWIIHTIIPVSGCLRSHGMRYVVLMIFPGTGIPYSIRSRWMMLYM